ncbi:hypothetical protein ZWY2020_046691 [Hordeum vulgare]|nr:hypothetical protein ZWY2020_046691 [Hordeum vulgare]
MKCELAFALQSLSEITASPGRTRSGRSLTSPAVPSSPAAKRRKNARSDPARIWSPATRPRRRQGGPNHARCPPTEDAACAPEDAALVPLPEVAYLDSPLDAPPTPEVACQDASDTPPLVLPEAPPLHAEVLPEVSHLDAEAPPLDGEVLPDVTHNALPLDAEVLPEVRHLDVEVFDNKVVPSSLRSIAPILRVAAEIDPERPRVAYLCLDRAHPRVPGRRWRDQHQRGPPRGSRYRNAVSGVVRLSDRQDNHTLSYNYNHDVATDYSVLVPPSLIRTGDGSSPPIHTFGFGTDHDSAAMHTIAEATAGTFSFIENEAVIHDSFAQCIGGLLSVTVQEVRVAIECVCPGVRVRSIKSGRYKSRVDADWRAASVDVGKLYADEERRFLLSVDVPTAGATDNVTSLMKVSCTYRDMATGQSVDVAGQDVVVKRPVGAEVGGRGGRRRLSVMATETLLQRRGQRLEHMEASKILRRGKT